MIKLTKKDFRFFLPFGSAYINEDWIASINWIVRMRLVERVPNIYYHYLQREHEKGWTQYMSDNYINVKRTNEVLYQPDIVEPEKRHAICVFKPYNNLVVIGVYKQIADTFNLTELRYNTYTKYVWTSGFNFITKGIEI